MRTGLSIRLHHDRVSGMIGSTTVSGPYYSAGSAHVRIRRCTVGSCCWRSRVFVEYDVRWASTGCSLGTTDDHATGLVGKRKKVKVMVSSSEVLPTSRDAEEVRRRNVAFRRSRSTSRARFVDHRAVGGAVSELLKTICALLAPTKGRDVQGLITGLSRRWCWSSGLRALAVRAVGHRP